MNIYQLLGALTAIDELPEGVIRINRDLGIWRVQMGCTEFLAAFPHHEIERFDSEFNRLIFKGDRITVLCLARKIREVA